MVESQIANVSGHLEKLGRQMSDRDQDLERRILTQNSDIGDLGQMLRNLTQKQGWCQDMKLPTCGI